MHNFTHYLFLRTTTLLSDFAILKTKTIIFKGKGGLNTKW